MSSIDPQKDYYSILELTSDAGPDDIRTAYRELVRRYHPDTGHGDVDRFRLVQEAYEILSDITYRRAYDRQRSARGLSQAGSVSLSMSVSRTRLPALDGDQVLYVLIDICPRTKEHPALRRLNLALVIDRSTSMQGARMHNMKLAARDLVDSLQPDDHLAIVTFSDRAETLASYSARDRGALHSAIASIAAAGGTEIYQGLRAGVAEVQLAYDHNAVNHVIVLTDGHTYGDEASALTAARRAEAAGIGVSAFGIGGDWNDVFLDDLARCGGGTSQYISVASQIRSALESQIQELTSLALRRAHLKSHLASYVHLAHAYRVSPHLEILTVDDTNTLNIGHVAAGEPTTLVLKLVIHHNQTGKKRIARFELSAEDLASQTPIQYGQDLCVTFDYAFEETEVTPRMLNVLARVSVFHLQEKAWQALTAGQVQQATQYLQSAATRLFDLGYGDLGSAAMLEVERLSRGSDPSLEGRKKLRYGTRALSISSS